MVHSHNFLHRRDLGERLREAASNLIPRAAKPDEGVETIYSIVYVTADATFSGAVAGYSTQTANKATTTTKTSSNTKKTSTASTSSTDVSQSATTTTGTAEQTSTVGTPVLAAQSTTSASSSATATTVEAASQTEGLSGGAKAGVAFGVIAILALVIGLALFFIKKKKQQKKEAQEERGVDNEKNGFALNHTPRNDNASRAPRLSLRPVTQFLPGIGEPKVQEMTSATGGLNSFFTPAPPAQQHKNPWDRKPIQNSSAAVNPFGSGAERIDEDAAADRAAENAPIPVTPPAAATLAAATNPFDDRPITSHSLNPSQQPSLATAPSSPPKLDVTIPAALAINAGALTGSPPKASNNVHRVQLDFKPSMEDEIELRAGDVVRVLHEYDDGWALCSRMDRSKQGVAPRTCLSKLPLKPRPNGPPPGMRPMNGASRSPNSRNFSGPPAPGYRNMYPAPLSPSMPNMNTPRGLHSPPQANRMRAHSHSQSMDNSNRLQMHQPMGLPSTPPKRDHRRSASMGQLSLGGSPSRMPARKPVPGQAI